MKASRQQGTYPWFRTNPAGCCRMLWTGCPKPFFFFRKCSEPFHFSWNVGCPKESENANKTNTWACQLTAMFGKNSGKYIINHKREHGQKMMHPVSLQLWPVLQATGPFELREDNCNVKISSLTQRRACRRTPARTSSAEKRQAVNPRPRSSWTSAPPSSTSTTRREARWGFRFTCKAMCKRHFVLEGVRHEWVWFGFDKNKSGTQSEFWRRTQMVKGVSRFVANMCKCVLVEGTRHECVWFGLGQVDQNKKGGKLKVLYERRILCFAQNPIVHSWKYPAVF